MPRSLWSGSLSFGLVNVPVALYSAVRDLDVHFHQLHEKDGARIETRRFCAEEDREVAYEEIGHGYDLDDGRTVILTDEDLEAAAPRRTRTIDVEAFVDLDEVDPIYVDHPYFLAPTGEAEGNLRAYQLLVEVLRSTDRAALGRFVLRTKEYLVLVRVRDDRLSLTTMRFHDEIRSIEGIPTGGRKPKRTELDAAVGLIKALSTDWDPTRYRDCFRERLLEVVRRKERHERIAAPAPAREEQGAPTDIMAALRASLERARGGAGDGDEGPRFTRETDGGRKDGNDGKDAGDLEDLSREELYERAKKADVPGRSKMSKDELVEALADRG